MKYIGDFPLGTRVRFGYNTATTGGVPIAWAADINGNPTVVVYRNESTTELTVGASIQLNFDGRTGYHLITVDTDNTGYTATADYRVVITAGTVDGVSRVGVEICHFSIQNRFVDSTAIANAIVAAMNADATQTTARTNAATAATEVGKLPRSSTAIPAGGNFAWNSVIDTANKLTLNITNEGP